MPIPVSKYRSGFQFSDMNAAKQVEIFIDLQCPHSKIAWPTIYALLTQADETIGGRLHLISLSNHRQSWELTKTVHLYAKRDGEKALGLIDTLFANQESFRDKAFYNKTHQDLYLFCLDQLRQYDKRFANSFQNLDGFIDALTQDELYHIGRTPNRYAAIKGVWGTPRFFFNDALLDLKADQDLQGYIQNLDKI